MLDFSCFIVTIDGKVDGNERGTRYSHSPFHSGDSRSDIDESVQDRSTSSIARQIRGHLPAVIELAFLGTASRRFLLVLLFNLWCLRLDLASTRKRSVNWVEQVLNWCTFETQDRTHTFPQCRGWNER